MDDVLAYQIWLKLPEETRAKLAELFAIPKTGSVNVETRATPDGKGYASFVKMDGYTPDNLRAISVEKMQAMLETDETDFYGMFETVVDHLEAIAAGTFKYRPNKKAADPETIVVGDRVVIRDAWEDSDGKAGDAYAIVTKIGRQGKLTLEYEAEEITEALKDFVYTLKDVEKAPVAPPHDPEKNHDPDTKTTE